MVTIKKIASEKLRFIPTRNEMVMTPTYAIFGTQGAMLGKLYKYRQASETSQTVAWVDWDVNIFGPNWQSNDDIYHTFPSFQKAKEWIANYRD